MAPGAGHDEMDGVRHHFARVEQIKGTLLGDDRHILPGGEPGGEHVLARGRGVLSEAVEAVPDAKEPTVLHVLGE